MRRFNGLFLFFFWLLTAGCSSAPNESIHTFVVGLAHICDERFEYFNNALALNARLALSRHSNNGVVQTQNGKVQIQFMTMPTVRNEKSPRQNFFETVHNYDVGLVIGNACSVSAISMTQAAEELQVPFLAPVTAAPAVTAGKIFSFPTSPSMKTRALAYASFLDCTLQARNIGLLARKDAMSGDIFYDALTEYFADRKNVRITKQTFDSKADLDVAAASLLESSPDAIVYCPLEPHIFDIGRLLAALGYHKALLGTQSKQAFGYAAYLPQPDMPVYCLSYWNPELPGTEGIGYVENFRNLTGRDPDEDDAYVYDTVLRFILALQYTDILSPQSLQKSLASQAGLFGALGHYDFTPAPVLEQLWLLALDNGELTFKELTQICPDMPVQATLPQQ